MGSYRNRDSGGRFSPTPSNVQAARSPIQALNADLREAARQEVIERVHGLAASAPAGLSLRARSLWVSDQVETWASNKPSVLAGYEGDLTSPLNAVRADAGWALATAA